MVKDEKNFATPASLLTESRKENGNCTYRCGSATRQDFHDKCYVCEMKDLQDPQIEHLLPHKMESIRSGNLTGKTYFGRVGIVIV